MGACKSLILWLPTWVPRPLLHLKLWVQEGEARRVGAEPVSPGPSLFHQTSMDQCLSAAVARLARARIVVVVAEAPAGLPLALRLLLSLEEAEAVVGPLWSTVPPIWRDTPTLGQISKHARMRCSTGGGVGSARVALAKRWLRRPEEVQGSPMEETGRV